MLVITMWIDIVIRHTGDDAYCYEDGYYWIKGCNDDVLNVSGHRILRRSGKIMRRILRKIAMWEIENLGDTSTLADPQVLQLLCRDSHFQENKK